MLGFYQIAFRDVWCTMPVSKRRPWNTAIDIYSGPAATPPLQLLAPSVLARFVHADIIQNLGMGLPPRVGWFTLPMVPIPFPPGPVMGIGFDQMWYQIAWPAGGPHNYRVFYAEQVFLGGFDTYWRFSVCF